MNYLKRLALVVAGGAILGAAFSFDLAWWGQLPLVLIGNALFVEGFRGKSAQEDSANEGN